MSGPTNEKLLLTIQPDTSGEIVMYVPGDDGITRAPQGKSIWEHIDDLPDDAYYSASDGVATFITAWPRQMRQMKGVVVGRDDNGNDIVEFVDA